MRRNGTGARPLIAAVLVLCGWAASAFAQQQGDATRREFSDADQQAIYEAQEQFDGCTEQAAVASLQDDVDVRRVLGNAVQHCAGTLDELNRSLVASGLDPGLLYGVIRGIKSHTIQRLLPQLMAARAQLQSAGSAQP